MHPPAAGSDAHHQGKLSALVLGAIGIVYGDIGTSPLYTLQECLHAQHGVAATEGNLLGLVSLIIWSLTLVVTVKYLAFVMRADNRGEGGIFALLALCPPRLRSATGGRVGWVAIAVIVGAALLFGDGIITPAISVLSAMEGLGVATHRLDPVIVPATCVILAILFSVQRFGTAGIGRFFGPVMVLWFVTLAALGASHVVQNPAILKAFSPVYGVTFFREHGLHGFRLLGSVVLAVTGGEALYADMGHFGRRPIRLAWLGLIFPALVLCYLGQGAHVLSHPEAASQPFFSMVPQGWATFALVALAAPATVIASQALISGVFSLTHQAVQLGFFPRVEVRHTSHDTEGQIYVPLINTVLAIACIVLVLVFRHSTKLAAAFGLAVSGTMAITSVVFYRVCRDTWGWSRARALGPLLLFLSFDLAFLGANLLKFFDGGYLPVAVGLVFFTIMLVWRQGRSLLSEHYAAKQTGLDRFTQEVVPTVPHRVPGAGVFMAASAEGTPPVLVHVVRRMRSLHETVILLTVAIEHQPTVPAGEQIEVTALPAGFYRVKARYGFTESPDVVAVLRRAAAEHNLPLRLDATTFFLGRETFLAGDRGKMDAAREGLFAFLTRNARNAALYFNVPAEQVIEVGMQFDL
ncbi:MAG: KUP/HAK/KT family potassium transporter [Myxococcales bacterium]|nr:KUP/HAK/KT family potassium transporter [Myxococcales bacterium]